MGLTKQEKARKDSKEFIMFKRSKLQLTRLNSNSN